MSLHILCRGPAPSLGTRSRPATRPTSGHQRPPTEVSPEDFARRSKSRASDAPLVPYLTPTLPTRMHSIRCPLFGRCPAWRPMP